MSVVHAIVPEGVDDPRRPSGGNVYDRRALAGLEAAGWTVRAHVAPGAWPALDAGALGALAGTVSRLPDGAVVLVDGLVASAASAVLVPEAGRLRLVVLVHMPLGHGAAGAAARAGEGAVLSAAAAVVATSEWARRVLLDLYALPGDRVHVAAPGVDPAALACGTASAGSLLSVAAVVPGKGHDVLVDALATVRGLSWDCVCVGSLERDPAFAEALRARVRARALEGRVRFAGPQSGAGLARSYGGADLLVLPSRSETYGMVIAEALACGLPVVASDVGGVPEALGHGATGDRPGLLVAPEDPDALGRALRAWLEDADLRRRLRRAARERRATLAGWTATASALARVLAGAAA